MRRSWLWTATVLVVIAALSYGLYVYLRPPRLPDQVLYANGQIEGTEVRISAEIKGRVIESALVEGHRVQKGAPLVRVDSTEIELQHARAAAEIAAIKQQGLRTRQELATWRHHVRTAEKDFERYRRLSERGNVPPQKLDEVANTLQGARGRVGALEAELKATDARLEAAKKELGIVETQLAKTTITSPIAGTVVVKAVEPGEYVAPGQTVAVLVDLTRIELKVYIPEKDLGKVKLEDPARIRVDSFPDRAFPGTVIRVDQRAQFTPRDIHLPEERVRTVFGVTLGIDNPDRILKPGMPADAWVLWQPGARWPDRLFVPR